MLSESAAKLVSQELLDGILPTVISGGRPTLKQRPIRKLLPQFHGVTADPVWVVRDDDAPGYESDGHEIVTYTREWADQYANSHWTGLTPHVAGESFLGAFPGREWACRIAEERGYWAVIQLDDNIMRICICRRHTTASVRIAREEGGLGMFTAVLAAITLATNGWMTGAFLTSVPPTDRKIQVSRPGFPYSLFLERTGPGREPWVGPYEDDITHAYQYGNNPNNATALLVPMLAYFKEPASNSGMRKNYDSTRSVTLQRMFPQTARIGVRATKSNGRGGPRVFHTMIPGAIRTPQIISDHELYGRTSAYLAGLAKQYATEYHERQLEKVEARANRARASAGDD